MGYISELLSQNTQGAKLALFMYGLVAVLALLCACLGFLRGISRQTIRLISIGAAAALAFIVARGLYPKILAACDGKTVEEIFSSVGAAQIYGKLSENVRALLGAVDSEALAQLLLLLTSMVLTPLAFMVLFAAFSLLLGLVHVCVSGMLGFTHRNNNVATRIFGAIFGAAEGILVGVVLLVPIVGLLNFSTEAVLRVEDPEHKVHALYDERLAAAAESPLAKTITTYGADKLFGALTEIKVDEQIVDTRAEANAIFDIYVGVETLRHADFKALNDVQKAAFSKIVTDLSENAYLAKITSGVLNSVGRDPSLFYNIMTNPDDPFSHMLAECLAVFETTDEQTLRTDLLTIRDMYFLLSDSGALHAMSEDSDSLAECLAATDETGLTVAKRVISVLDANERTRPLIGSITRMTVSNLLGNESLDLGTDTAAVYDEIKRGIAEDVLTIVKDETNPEAYTEAVSAALADTFLASDITMSDESLDTMAQYISDHYANLETVTDDVLNDIIISYYAAHIAE